MRFSYFVVAGAVALFSVGCSQGANEAKPPASPSASVTTRAIDPADAAACSAFKRAITGPLQRIQEAAADGVAMPILFLVAEESASEARLAAAAASPDLKALIERTAGSLDLMAAKAKRSLDGTVPFDIAVESEAVTSSSQAALKLCPTT